MSQTALNLINNIALFQGLTTEQLSELLQGALEGTYPPDTVIIQEGTVGEAFFVILSGEVKITKRLNKSNKETDHLLLSTRRTGDIFGEMTLFDKKPRSAQVTATTMTRVLIFNRSHLNWLMKNYPTFFLKILQVFICRLREADDAHVQHVETKIHELELLNELQEKRIDNLQKKIRALEQQKE